MPRKSNQPAELVGSFSHEEFLENKGFHRINKTNAGTVLKYLRERVVKFTGNLVCRPTHLVSKTVYNVDRGVSSILLAFNLFNLAEVSFALLQNKDERFGYHALEFLSALGFSGYALEGVGKAWWNDAKIDVLYAGSKQSKKFIQITSKRLNMHLTPLTAAGAAAGAFSSLLTLNSIYDDIKRYDRGASIGHTIILSGDLLTMASIFSSATISASELTTAGFLTPWGLIATLLIFIGTLLVIRCSDDALTKWAKESPFAKHPISGNIPMGDAKAYQALLTILLQASISIQKTPGKTQEKDYHDIQVQILFGYFIVGKMTLELHCSWARQIPHYQRITGKIHLQGLDQHPTKPYRIEQLLEEENQQIIGMRYFYRILSSTDNEVLTCYSAKARIYRADAEIPVSKDPFILNPRADPNWIYAEPLCI